MNWPLLAISLFRGDAAPLRMASFFGGVLAPKNSLYAPAKILENQKMLMASRIRHTMRATYRSIPRAWKRFRERFFFMCGTDNHNSNSIRYIWESDFRGNKWAAQARRKVDIKCIGERTWKWPKISRFQASYPESITGVLCLDNETMGTGVGTRFT